MTKPKIAVLGAGPMGLAAAYQLAMDGYNPVLFEAADRVGGMTASFNFNGLDIERFYHFHCVSDDDFFKVLAELGIAEQLQWTETKMGYWFQNRLQPWGNPLALLRFKGLSFTAKLRYGLHAFCAAKRNNWQSLDKIEASQWIKRWVGAEAWEVLWRRLFDYKFYNYAQDLSAAWIWSRIRRIGRSRYNIFKEKLGYLRGGSNTLLTAIKSYIEAHGGEIRLNTPVEQVVITDGQIVGLKIAGKTEIFDKVISTIPLPYIEKLIPDLPVDVLKKFKALKNVAVVCVIAKLKQSVSPYFWLNINDPDADIPGVVEYTNLAPLAQHIVYAPFYVPGEHPVYAEADDVFANKVRKYLKRINPALVDADFLDVHVHRYRYAQPVCGPEYLKNLPPVGLPITGLWVADTSYYYPEDRGISESIGFGRMMAKKAVS